MYCQYVAMLCPQSQADIIQYGNSLEVYYYPAILILYYNELIIWQTSTRMSVIYLRSSGQSRSPGLQCVRMMMAV